MDGASYHEHDDDGEGKGRGLPAVGPRAYLSMVSIAACNAAGLTRNMPV